MTLKLNNQTENKGTSVGTNKHRRIGELDTDGQVRGAESGQKKMMRKGAGKKGHVSR